MKTAVLSLLLTLSILLTACTCPQIEQPTYPDASEVGPPACLTIIKFANKSHQDYLIAGHPLVDYNPFTYDESRISFANNALYAFEEETNEFIDFVEQELKVCGKSP